MSDNVLQFPQEEQKKKKRPVWRLIGTGILVLAVVTVIACWDTLNFDQMMRNVSTWGLRTEDNFGSHTLVEHTSSQYALFDGGMISASVGGAVLLDRATSRQVKVADAMNYPSVEVGKHSVLAYDIGGTALVVAKDTMETVLSVKENTSILDGDITADDWVAYSALGEGFQTTVTVCNPNGQVVYRWNDADSYLSQCTISPGGEFLATMEFGQKDGYFQAVAHIFETDQETAGLEVNLGDQMIYDMKFLSQDVFVAVGETELLFLSTEGEILSTVSYEGQSLQFYDIWDGGNVVLALDKMEGGTQLQTYDKNGELMGETQLEEAVVDLSVNGAYVAVLTATSLEIYKDTLKSYGASEDVVGITSILMEENGGCLLLRGGQISLFNP